MQAGQSDSRRARAFWLASLLLIAALLVLFLWLLVRTAASAGMPADTVREAVLRADTSPGTAEAADGTDEAKDRTAEAADSTDTTAESGTEVAAAGAAAPADGTDPDEDIVYYRRRNDRMDIALSFDDGPHPVYTPEILSILREYGVTATFFMVGENVTYYPEAARAVMEAGHEVGNHSFTHKRLSALGESAVRDELSRCEDAIASVGECRPHLLRPPEGSLNPMIRRLSRELDYRIILWDVDTRDWAHTPPEVIAAGILDRIQAGDIILMHDYIGRDSPTPAALRIVLPELLRRGYNFVTVSTLIDEA